MGVGAAIAMGSHGEKGYKALFVMKVRTNMIAKILETTLEEKKVKSG
jgi:hypothetical protein